MPQDYKDPSQTPPLSRLQKPFEGAMEGLRGIIGSIVPGAGVPESTAGHVGELLATGAPVIGGMGRLPRILEEVFAANPAARGAYERAMTSQLAEASQARQAADAAKYARAADAHDALLDLDVAGNPRIVPTETGFSFAIPRPEAPAGPPTPDVGPKLVSKQTGKLRSKASQTAPGFESKFTTTESIPRK